MLPFCQTLCQNVCYVFVCPNILQTYLPHLNPLSDDVVLNVNVLGVGMVDMVL